MTRAIKVRFSVTGFAVGPDGSRAPFSLAVTEPYPHPRFDWQCRVVCPHFRQAPIHIYGDEPEFARDLALGYVHRMLGLKGETVVGEDGDPIPFPKPDAARWGLGDKSEAWHLQNQ